MTKDFNVHILGCGSALPTGRHLPTAQVVEIRGKLYLVDCGEGAQRGFRRNHLSFSKLTAVFISHLHGDHCFGLWGLISTLGLLGRQAPLPIYGPKGIEPFLLSFLDQFGEHLPFTLEIHTLPDREHQLVYEDRGVKVYSLPLDHRMPTLGYRFEEQVVALHLDREAARFWQVPLASYPAILRGEDYITPDGERIANKRLTRPGRSPKRYAYCSDTAYRPALIPLIAGVDLLYHEATFLHERLGRAKQTGHTTALQAGQIAQEAGVKTLLIGHYSSRYESETPLLEEAQSIFPNTMSANEGMILSLDQLPQPQQ